MYRQNLALGQQINTEKKRQAAYQKMKSTQDGLLAKIAEQEEEQARLLKLKAELSKRSQLMEAEALEAEALEAEALEAEALQAQKAADAKHGNEDDTVKE
jgi:hypothetical protein